MGTYQYKHVYPTHNHGIWDRSKEKDTFNETVASIVNMTPFLPSNEVYILSEAKSEVTEFEIYKPHVNLRFTR